MQSCKPGAFLGKRARLSAMARTEGVEQAAGLWFRVDGPMAGKSLNFDNMQNRPLKGTSDWQPYSVALDVATEAIMLAYGILLSGVGSAWIADMHIEITELAIPSANLKIGKNNAPEAPVNLSFSDGSAANGNERL
jgi:hypothetical protein